MGINYKLSEDLALQREMPDDDNSFVPFVVL